MNKIIIGKNNKEKILLKSKMKELEKQKKLNNYTKNIINVNKN